MYMAVGSLRHEIARRFHGLFCHQEWNVGIVKGPIQAFLERGAPPAVEWLPPLAKGRYVADPFGIERDGHVYVFFEEFSYASNKGVINWIRLGPNGRSSMGNAIDMPFHVSYPFLFDWDDAVYLVPESAQANEVALYRAEAFPSQWRKVATLIPNFAGIDPTLFVHEDRWWMICTDLKTGPNELLFIWYADGPLGPWRPHARNPVPGNLNGTRPAGTPFEHHGDLYRPAMDSTRTYGRRIVLNRVDTLTPSEFHEEPAGIVEPFSDGRYRDGVHTLSALGGMTLVDGLRVTFERDEYERSLKLQTSEARGWMRRHLSMNGPARGG